MTRISHTYPRQRRIRKRKDFLACYDGGRKYHCAHFMLFALPQPGFPAKFGIAVSRKVGNAVARNRLKRLLREFFRLQTAIARDFEIVAIAKKNAFDMGYGRVRDELLPLMLLIAKSSDAHEI